MTPQRAQAVHKIDEAWTMLIDQINADIGAAESQLVTLATWKATPPEKIVGLTAKRLAYLAWLAMSEAVLRATEEGDVGCGSS